MMNYRRRYIKTPHTNKRLSPVRLVVTPVDRDGDVYVGFGKPPEQDGRYIDYRDLPVFIRALIRVWFKAHLAKWNA